LRNRKDAQLVDSPHRPKLFYGYFIIVACFIILFHLWGMVLNTLPIFLKPITEDMGWSRGDFSVAALAGGLASLIAAPIAGRIVDVRGPKPVLIAGTLMIGFGLLGASRTSQLWHFYVANLAIGTGLMCGTIIPCSALISNWFVSRRGTAMAVSFAGTACGGLVMSPVAEWIIRTFSWRTAFVAGGIQILAVTLLVIFLAVRNRPSDMGLEPYRIAGEAAEFDENWGVSLKQAASMRVFWLLSVIMLLIALVTGGVNYHCVAYLTDLGHSETRAAYAWSVVMGAMVLGKLAVGPVIDRWGSSKTMAVSAVLFALSYLILIHAHQYQVVMIFAGLYGFSLGAPLALNPLLTSDYLGMKHFGALFGVLSIMGLVGGSVGPVIAGKVFDTQDSYLLILYSSIAVSLLAAALCVFLTRSSLNRAGAKTELSSG
jgi:MFS family permease